MRLFFYCVFIILMTALISGLIWFWNAGSQNSLFYKPADSNSNLEQSMPQKDDNPIVRPSQQSENSEQTITSQDPFNPQSAEPQSSDNLAPLNSNTDRDINKAEQRTFCTKENFENKSYVVCRANPAIDHIELFLNDADNKPYNRFYRLENALNTKGKTLAFAMNAGMYHADYSAVGLYIENGKELYPVSTKDGPGNFHMKPNGIFFINNGKAGVLNTDSFLALGLKPQLATQSGPMLVINNAIHHRFIPQSPYLEYRNGVGVTDEGEVIFIISEQKVNFDEMARFFRDKLKTPNALFFDGSISSLYAPELSRKDWWHGLGPIIAVTLDKSE